MQRDNVDKKFILVLTSENDDAATTWIRDQHDFLAKLNCHDICLEQPEDFTLKQFQEFITSAKVAGEKRHSVCMSLLPKTDEMKEDAFKSFIGHYSLLKTLPFIQGTSDLLATRKNDSSFHFIDDSLVRSISAVAPADKNDFLAMNKVKREKTMSANLLRIAQESKGDCVVALLGWQHYTVYKHLMDLGVNHQSIMIFNIYSIQQFWQYTISSEEHIDSENAKLVEREKNRAAECPAGMYHAFDVDSQNVSQTKELLEKRFVRREKIETPLARDLFSPVQSKTANDTKNNVTIKPKNK